MKRANERKTLKKLGFAWLVNEYIQHRTSQAKIKYSDRNLQNQAHNQKASEDEEKDVIFNKSIIFNIDFHVAAH